MLNPETDALASHLDRVLSEHVAEGRDWRLARPYPAGRGGSDPRSRLR